MFRRGFADSRDQLRTTEASYGQPLTGSMQARGCFHRRWQVMGSNHRRLSRRLYRPLSSGRGRVALTSGYAFLGAGESGQLTARLLASVPSDPAGPGHAPAVVPSGPALGPGSRWQRQLMHHFSPVVTGSSLFSAKATLSVPKEAAAARPGRPVPRSQPHCPGRATGLVAAASVHRAGQLADRASRYLGEHPQLRK